MEIDKIERFSKKKARKRKKGKKKGKNVIFSENKFDFRLLMWYNYNKKWGAATPPGEKIQSLQFLPYLF